MKYLEIKDEKAYYRKGEEMIEIDSITKDDLLNILNSAGGDDFEMDDYNQTLLPNKAHQIIYENIHTKLSAFLADKTQFDRKVEGLYAEAIGEYDADIDSEEAVDSLPESTDEEEINPEDIPF